MVKVKVSERLYVEESSLQRKQIPEYNTNNTDDKIDN